MAKDKRPFAEVIAELGYEDSGEPTQEEMHDSVVYSAVDHIEELHERLSVGLSNFGDPGNGLWLRALLTAASEAAHAAGQKDLSSVLFAFENAYGAGDLDRLLTRTPHRSMIGAARSYLNDGGKPGRKGRSGVFLLGFIARKFEGDPDASEVDGIVREVAGKLRALEAQRLLGPPLGPLDAECEEKILAQCLKVSERDTKEYETDASFEQRKKSKGLTPITKPRQSRKKNPADYARAFLRGWGLSPSDAKDWIKSAGIDG